MAIQLDSIKFNHAPRRLDSDALTLGRNGTTLVRVPEWQNGGSLGQSVAAYAIRETDNHPITIQARFRLPAPQFSQMEVQALDAHNTVSNVLGTVMRNQVNFNFDTLSQFVTFTLNDTRLAQVGVGTHIVRWRWQVRLPPSANFTDFAVTTHKIYTVLGLPNLPWEQPPLLTDEIQLPWVEVLDWACHWARGARTADEAAEMVTRNIHALGPQFIEYDEHGGQSTYTYLLSEQTGSQEFLCNRFLRLLRGEGIPPHRLVNCSDCATIVSTFANILGCNLSPSRMSPQPPDNQGFRLNLIRPVGFSQWSPNFDFGGFSYHEVAWKGACTENDPVYDACLQLDRDDDPTAAPHDPLLAINLRFGVPGDGQYGDLLARNAPGGRERCLPSRQPIRVRIGDPDQPEPPLPPEVLLTHLMLRFDFKSERDLPTSAQRLLIWNFQLLDEVLLDWQLFEVTDLFSPTKHARSLETIWRGSDGASFLRLNVYECASQDAALKTLFGLLGQISLPRLPRLEGIGDVAFSTPSRIMIQFVRGNLAVLIRDASPDPQSVEAVAAYLDRILTDRSDDFNGFATDPEENFFEPAPIDTKQGEPVGLLTDAISARRQRSWYKFFAPSGDFRIIDGRPHYLPTDSGEQEISMFRIDTERRTNGTQMRFSV